MSRDARRGRPAVRIGSFAACRPPPGRRGPALICRRRQGTGSPRSPDCQTGSAGKPGRTADQNQQTGSRHGCPARDRRQARQTPAGHCGQHRHQSGHQHDADRQRHCGFTVEANAPRTPYPGAQRDGSGQDNGAADVRARDCRKDRPCRHAQSVHSERPKVQQGESRCAPHLPPHRRGPLIRQHGNPPPEPRRPRSCSGRQRAAPHGRARAAPGDAASRPCGCIRAIRSRRASSARRSWVFPPERPRLARRVAKTHATRPMDRRACAEIVAAMGRQNQRPINPDWLQHAAHFLPGVASDVRAAAHEIRMRGPPAANLAPGRARPTVRPTKKIGERLRHDREYL